MINKFENPKTGKLFDDYTAEKFRHRSRQLYRFYVKNDRNLWKKCKICDEVLPHSRKSDEMKHVGKKKKKSGKKGSGSGQKKAWVTMRKNAKKASWRRRFPNHSLTKEWKRKH